MFTRRILALVTDVTILINYIVLAPQGSAAAVLGLKYDILSTYWLRTRVGHVL